MNSGASLRIVAVTTSYPRRPGDLAGRFVLDLHAGFQELGHRVLTLCPGAPGIPGEEENEAGRVRRLRYAAEAEQDLFYGDGAEANWRRVAGPRAKLRAFLASAAGACCREPADLLLAHWIWPSGVPVVGAARARGLPALGVGHGGDLHLLGRPIAGRWLARRLRSGFEGILCTSRAGESVVRRRGLARRTAVAPMGADPSRFHPGPHAALPGWPRDYLLGLGRLIPLKGFDLLVRAAAARSLTTVVAGDGPERDRLEALARELEAPVFFPGRLDHELVPRALGNARALVIPSRRLRGGRTEGCPTVAVEALLCGTPVIASDVGGLGDLLPRSALSGPDDLQGLCGALDRLPPRGTQAARPPAAAVRGATARAILGLLSPAPVPG